MPRFLTSTPSAQCSTSQIVREVGVHEIRVIGGLKIDRVGQRSVLQRNRALDAEAAGHAFYLLLDRILPKRIVANPPDALERRVTISRSAKLLERTGRYTGPVELHCQGAPAFLSSVLNVPGERRFLFWLELLLSGRCSRSHLFCPAQIVEMGWLTGLHFVMALDKIRRHVKNNWSRLLRPEPATGGIGIQG